MRITGGIYRSRKLETPKSDAVRPTSDKVRQALFNSLNSRGTVIDSHVLDAFCGTGALGLEALSQGASSVTLMDIAKASYALCQRNIEILGVQEKTELKLQDATKIKPLAEEKTYDLVFLDPPYRKGLVDKTLKALNDGGWLSKDHLIVIEMAKDEILNMPLFNIDQQKTYGETQIILGSF